MNLQPGDYVTVNELLHGLLIASYNDCAIALARYVAGSVGDFVDLMNAKAAQLGATNSHFVNPHGLHDNNHYTTPYDLYVSGFGKSRVLHNFYKWISFQCSDYAHGLSYYRVENRNYRKSRQLYHFGICKG